MFARFFLYRALSVFFLLMVEVFNGGFLLNVQAQSPGAVTDAVPSLPNLQDLPFCDIPLKQLIDEVKTRLIIAQGTGAPENTSLESLYSSLLFLYNQKKADFESGTSSLDPDLFNYCLLTRDVEFGIVEIPLVRVSGVLGSGYTKMVVSAEKDRAVIKEIAGIPTNIELYFFPEDLEITRANIVGLIQSVFFQAFILYPETILDYAYYYGRWPYTSYFDSTILSCPKGLFPTASSNSFIGTYRIETSNGFRPGRYEEIPTRISRLRDYKCPN